MTNPKVVLTSDKTIMSHYFDGAALGFMASFSHRLTPGPLFSSLFCPPMPITHSGRAKFAPCGMRKIEAALLANDFTREEVAVVAPKQLDQFVGPETEIVSITHDSPMAQVVYHEVEELMGLGPPRSRIEFQRLLEHPAIREHGPSIVVGGKGAWEITPERQDELGIDHVFIGEGEVDAPRVFKEIIRGEEVPPRVYGTPPSLDQIPNCKGACINGIVEVSRGCDRGCKFCTPTQQGLRHRPMENIMGEVDVNLSADLECIVLHAEDGLRYGSNNGFHVDEERLMRLIKGIKARPGVKTLDFDHVSLSTVYHNPDIVGRATREVGVGSDQAYMGTWTGIETGSTRLIEEYMPGKPPPPRQGIGPTSSGAHTRSWKIIIGYPSGPWCLASPGRPPTT